MSTATAFADSAALDRAAEGGVASHLFRHGEGQTPALRASRDRAGVVLDRVEVDDIGVGRQLPRLMQRDRVLDQGADCGGAARRET